MDVSEVVRRWREAVNKGEAEAFGAAYAADAVLYTPLTPEGVKGREGVEQYEGALFKAFPGCTLKTSPVVAGEDIAAVEWEWSGKHTGPLVTAAGTVPPTNRSVALRGASFLRIDAHGKIAEEHRYYDSKSLSEQLGLK